MKRKKNRYQQVKATTYTQEDERKIIQEDEKKIQYNDQQQQEGSREIIVYDEGGSKEQDSFCLKMTLLKTIMTTFSLRVIAYALYVYVIKHETEGLVQDIIKLNERFANNSYTRIINELQIFISNTISSNNFDSYKCALYGYIKSKTVEESQTFVSEIIKSLTDSRFETEFFTQIYYDTVKSSMGIGADLETIKRFVVVKEDLEYDPFEKNNLRGAHSQLSELRGTYTKKMSYYYRYETSTDNEQQEDTFALFTEKIKTLITNPDMMMCNQILSQNRINIDNLKQNVVAVNKLTVKDMYATILDSTDGVISVRIQNSITKSVYCIVAFSVVALALYIYRKVKQIMKKL